MGTTAWSLRFRLLGCCHCHATSFTRGVNAWAVWVPHAGNVSVAASWVRGCYCIYAVQWWAKMICKPAVQVFAPAPSMCTCACAIAGVTGTAAAPQSGQSHTTAPRPAPWTGNSVFRAPVRAAAGSRCCSRPLRGSPRTTAACLPTAVAGGRRHNGCGPHSSTWVWVMNDGKRHRGRSVRDAGTGRMCLSEAKCLYGRCAACRGLPPPLRYSLAERQQHVQRGRHNLGHVEVVHLQHLQAGLQCTQTVGPPLLKHILTAVALQGPESTCASTGAAGVALQTACPALRVPRSPACSGR